MPNFFDIATIVLCEKLENRFLCWQYNVKSAYAMCI